MVNASGEITRQLDGGSLKAMEELYGTVYPLRFIGSFDEGKLVGLATWKFEEWNSTTFLCDIRVKEAHRNQGIAGRLLEDLQWASMRLDARGILLETQNTNVPAVEFYQKRGFRLVGFNTSTYGEPNRCGVDVALFFFLSLGG